MLRKYYFTAFFFLGIISVSFAQKKWNGKIVSGLFYYSGNVEKFDFTTDANVAHTDSMFEYSSFAKMVYSSSAGKRLNEEYNAGVKFDYHPYNTYSPFMLLSYYKNDFKDIHLRLTALMGLKYVYYKTESSNFSISLAFQYDAEHYQSEIADQDKIRWSLRPKFKQKITNSLYFENLEFFKVNISDGTDYAIESITTISNKVTNRLSIGLNYHYEYVNAPTNPALKKADQVFTAQVLFSL